MIVTVGKIRNALRRSNRLRLLASCLGLVGWACDGGLNLTSMAIAQQWPTKRIQVVVPIGAGSATDLTARTALEQVAAQLGQPIVIENRPGAGNTIGMAAVARAEPDGYTLLVSGASHSVVPITYSKLPFDVFRDLVPIIPFGTTPIVLVALPSKGYKTIHDLIAAAKAKKGAFNYSSAGVGQVTHFATEAFRIAAGFEAVHVPYRSAPEALTAVLSGQAEFYMSPLAAVFQLLKDGKLQALAISGSQRASAIPDVPTLQEAGFSQVNYSLWVGLFAPAKTPAPILDRLHRETEKAVRSPTINERFAKLGIDPMPMPASAFSKMIQDEYVMNAKIAKMVGIKAQ